MVVGKGGGVINRIITAARKGAKPMCLGCRGEGMSLLESLMGTSAHEKIHRRRDAENRQRNLEKAWQVMALRAEKIASYRRDFAEQFEWYARKAGVEVAWRFQAAVDTTIARLLQNPTIGRPRHFKHQRMQGW